MNRIEEQQLKLIESLLDDLQAFIELYIIDGKSMTAPEIATKFIAENPCNVTAEDLAIGFRLAVREGRITGIEGARGVGFRQCDGNHVPSAQKNVLAFVPVIPKLQAVIDKYIQGKSTLDADGIFKKFAKEHGDCGLSKSAFISQFRASVKDGKITGIEGAGRAGYRRITAKPAVKPKPTVVEPTVADSEAPEAQAIETAEEDVSGKCEIVVDENRRIIAVDDKNWAYQKKGGSSWMTTAYFNNCSNMVQSIARKMIEEKLKTLESFNFIDLEQKVREAELHLAGLIQQSMMERDWKKICAKLRIPTSSRSEEVLVAIQSLIDAANVSTQTVVESPRRGMLNPYPDTDEE